LSSIKTSGRFPAAASAATAVRYEFPLLTMSSLLIVIPGWVFSKLLKTVFRAV
jgi:putative cell wall-binding protein